MLLCVFSRERLGAFEHISGLAFDVTWLASREEQILTRTSSASAGGRRRADGLPAPPPPPAGDRRQFRQP
jgi:hypothetical protein